MIDVIITTRTINAAIYCPRLSAGLVLDVRGNASYGLIAISLYFYICFCPHPFDRKEGTKTLYRTCLEFTFSIPDFFFQLKDKCLRLKVVIWTLLSRQSDLSTHE